MTSITDYLDKTLIPEWRKCWKMLSVLWNTVCAAAAPAWVVLTDDQKQSILSIVGVHPALYVSAAFLISILLRMKSQGISATPQDRTDPS